MDNSDAEVSDYLSRNFDEILIKKIVSRQHQEFYQKWLRFYSDFCYKYGHDPLQPVNLPRF